MRRSDEIVSHWEKVDLYFSLLFYLQRFVMIVDVVVVVLVVFSLFVVFVDIMSWTRMSGGSTRNRMKLVYGCPSGIVCVFERCLVWCELSIYLTPQTSPLLHFFPCFCANLKTNSFPTFLTWSTRGVRVKGNTIALARASYLIWTQTLAAQIDPLGASWFTLIQEGRKRKLSLSRSYHLIDIHDCGLKVTLLEWDWIDSRVSSSELSVLRTTKRNEMKRNGTKSG